MDSGWGAEARTTRATARATAWGAAETTAGTSSGAGVAAAAAATEKAGEAAEAAAAVGEDSVLELVAQAGNAKTGSATAREVGEASNADAAGSATNTAA